MGQCSTLPAEARASSSNGPYQNSNDTLWEQKRRLNEGGRKESLDFNKIIPADPTPQGGDSMTLQENKRNSSRGMRKEDSSSSMPIENMQTQARDPEQTKMMKVDPEPMEEDSREEAPVPIPPPPEGAVRTRCYKLNLDSECVGLNPIQKHQICVGPFTEPPPYLTYCSSEDSSQSSSGTGVAVQTAQIFRGITVGRDGTILSQNARATRSNRGNKTKKGEKSRQAAKIDKAKDLVEEAVASGKSPESEEPANMVSLVIVGEYDDMKHLVRDGSKKLREAEGLPDDALLSANRPRASQKPKKEVVPQPPPPPPPAAPEVVSSPRKRVSPNYTSNNLRTAAIQSPDKLQRAELPQSAPPKLKSHPRDTRPVRREDRAGSRVRLDSCHDFMDPRRAEAAGDGDWSHAWNIWNCGGTGTVSPLHQPSSPKDTKAIFEGREAIYAGAREGGVHGRAA